MQLEDFFDFNTEPVEHIRIKGTRIDIDHVIVLYKKHMTPERIAEYFICPITIEQAYATILYYLINKIEVEAYLERGEERFQRNYQEHLAQPEHPVVTRIKAIKAARIAAGQS